MKGIDCDICIGISIVHLFRQMSNLMISLCFQTLLAQWVPFDFQEQWVSENKLHFCKSFAWWSFPLQSLSKSPHSSNSPEIGKSFYWSLFVFKHIRLRDYGFDFDHPFCQENSICVRKHSTVETFALVLASEWRYCKTSKKVL